MARAVAVLGPPGRLRAQGGLAGTGALDRGGIDHPHVVGPHGGVAGQDRVARPLVDAGVGPEELASMNLGAVPASADLARMRERRAALGLPYGDDAPLLLAVDGARISSAQVPLHLRRARMQRIGIEINGEYCRSLLQARYPAAT